MSSFTIHQVHRLVYKFFLQLKCLLCCGCKIYKIFSRVGQKEYWDLILKQLHKLNKKMSVEHCCNIKGEKVWYNKLGTCIHTCWEMIGAITITRKCPWYWTYKTVSHTLLAIFVVHNSLLFAGSQQKPLICCSRSYWAVYSLCGEGNDWEPSQSLVPAMQGNTYLEMYLRKRK